MAARGAGSVRSGPVSTGERGASARGTRPLREDGPGTPHSVPRGPRWPPRPVPGPTGAPGRPTPRSFREAGRAAWVSHWAPPPSANRGQGQRPRGALRGRGEEEQDPGWLGPRRFLLCEVGCEPGTAAGMGGATLCRSPGPRAGGGRGMGTLPVNVQRAGELAQGRWTLGKDQSGRSSEPAGPTQQLVGTPLPRASPGTRHPHIAGTRHGSGGGEETGRHCPEPLGPPGHTAPPAWGPRAAPQLRTDRTDHTDHTFLPPHLPPALKCAAGNSRFKC